MFALMRARLLWLFLSLGVFAVLPAKAQTEDEFPTSQQTPVHTWENMTADAHNASNQSGFTQCLRAAAIDATDSLTKSKCYYQLALWEDATSDACRYVTVPDKNDIIFDYMNYRRDNKSYVDQAVKMSLPNGVKAQICDLGDGVYSYFFRGEPGKSCNNVGFVVDAQAVPAAPTKAKVSCRQVRTVVHKHDSGGYEFLPGSYHPQCCLNCGAGIFTPGLFIDNTSSSPDKTVTYTKICTPEGGE